MKDPAECEEAVVQAIFDFALTDAEMQQIAALDTGHTAFTPRTTGPAVDAFLKAALDYKV